MANLSQSKTTPFTLLQKQIIEEVERSAKVLKDGMELLDQSQVELAKLTQRNAVINGHLQQMQTQLESIPRADIKSAYSAALDTQQRLLVLRGQIEKLQSEQSCLKNHIDILSNWLKAFESTNFDQGTTDNSEILSLVMKAQEAERQRLSRLMHDGPAQALSNFIVQTEITSRLFDVDINRSKNELENLRAAALNAFQKVRLFISELHPMILDDLGLYPTIKRYVDTFREQTGAEVNLTLIGQERRFEPYIEILMFRAVQELMANAVRNNVDAAGRISINIQISFDDKSIKINVSDNGKGFNLQELSESAGLGLKLIRERIEMLEGLFVVDSAVGQGCRITMQVTT